MGTYVCVRACTCVYVQVRMCTCAHVRVHMYTFVYVRVHTCTYVFVRVRKGIYLCVGVPGNSAQAGARDPSPSQGSFFFFFFFFLLAGTVANAHMASCPCAQTDGLACIHTYLLVPTCISTIIYSSRSLLYPFRRPTSS